MKIAVISDIHGNVTALNAVLHDIEKEGCEQIFCLGDLAMAGSQPKETIDIIRNLRNITVIQGNTDKMIVDAYRGNEYGDSLMETALKDDIKYLNEEQINFLKNLPEQTEVTVDGFKILLVHGSPRANNENISPDLPIEKVEEIIKDTDADIILCGHTHLPCGFQTSTNQTVINDGSVGRPRGGNIDSCYAIIDFKNNSFEIKHKFVRYNNSAEKDLILKRNYRGREKLAKALTEPSENHPY